jgi:hypothetical protein
MLEAFCDRSRPQGGVGRQISRGRRSQHSRDRRRRGRTWTGALWGSRRHAGCLQHPHRQLIASLAAQYRVPAIYAYRYFVISGGLISYGIDIVELYRGAASFVSRVLRGEKPAELPVRAPTNFELVINLKAVKALGLKVSQTLLARADEVIE